ncbi:DUF5709 domain-containing protein [Dactylosporangium fulvum]|uniref:DUF5709 domain-containing protein n=1 Tax=Dactylosporangium fulvum TaxID=53359 RepID=A0ABY5W9Y8_9ACTN|nr:DUF5709 domain-containing protein [Dactylosporangium fulvum]UWP86304.1 DUF5709 domain-containing protein [Dactylosporangium fulvum]
MREDTFPRPVSDPEAKGLPGVADDDSHAWDEVESPRISDGPEPAGLPLDRDDMPLAVGHYGLTPEEARVGEPLDLKLRREEPDPALNAAGDEEERSDAVDRPASAETFDPDALGTDIDAVDENTELDDFPDDETAWPDPHSHISVYDTGPGRRSGTVGRLVEPDEGTGEDTEKDMIAYDAGAAGGGPTAEEAAVHEVPGR